MKKLSSCKGIIAVILFFLIMICFAGCQLWYQDLKGYLEHWTDTVQVKDFVVLSSPESQKNSSGFETISTNASVTATVNIINPENYSLDTGVGFAEDTLRSVRISGPAGSAVLPLTTVTSASPTSMEVQLAPLTQVLTKESLALEHTNFTVTFVPTRAENGLSALGAQNITLRYNTPPRMPLEVVYDKVTGKLGWMKSEQDRWDIVQGTGTDLDNLIFWAWPSGITDPTHPDYVEKFEVYEDGVLFDDYLVDECLMSNESTLEPLVPQDLKNAGYNIFCSLGTTGKAITVYAIDGEGVKSLAAVSGKAPHPITLEANGGLFGSNPGPVTVYKADNSRINGNDLDAPTRPGYYLSGWTTSAGGSPLSFPYTVKEPVTLYAQWTPNPSTGSDITGPGAVTGISSIKKNNFEPVITWTNPSDSDFDRTEITCSDGNISITINGNVATFMGIDSGKEYEVTFTTYDYTGNIGQTVTQKLTWNTIALDSLIGTGFTENGVDVSNPNATGSKLVLWFLSGETISLAEYIQYEPNVTADATFTWWKNPVTGGKVTSSDSIILDKAYTFYANYSVMSADYAVVYVEAALKGTSSCTHDITVVGSMTNDQLKVLGSPLRASDLPPVEINLDLSQTTGLTTIVKDAFRGAERLTYIILPESIESIEEGAFHGCSFSSIEFPSSLKTLGKDAFRNCKNLEQVIMPSSSSLSSIGEQAFMDCRKLSQITIPSSVTVIDKWAFYWCKSITSLTIPASVRSIVDPFYECGRTLVLTMEASNPPNIEGGMEVKQIRVPKDSVDQYKAVGVLSNVQGRIVGY